jgi:hypothetical protein
MADRSSLFSCAEIPRFLIPTDGAAAQVTLFNPAIHNNIATSARDVERFYLLSSDCLKRATGKCVRILEGQGNRRARAAMNDNCQLGAALVVTVPETISPRNSFRSVANRCGFTLGRIVIG